MNDHALVYDHGRLDVVSIVRNGSRLVIADFNALECKRIFREPRVGDWFGDKLIMFISDEDGCDKEKRNLIELKKDNGEK